MNTSIDPRSTAHHAARRAIDGSLFEWPSATPVLLASECTVCKAKSFPRVPFCPACGSHAVATRTLPSRGSLWTWTIQRFMPKSPYASLETPESFVPFGVGYVELAESLRLETRLTENDPRKLRIGMPLELTFYVHRIDADGTEIINYAFKPSDLESVPET